MLDRHNPDSQRCQRCGKLIWADKTVTKYPRDFVWPCNGRKRTDTLWVPVILCRKCGKASDGTGTESGDYNHAMLGGIIIPFTKYSLPFILTVLDSYVKRTGTVEEVCEQWDICRNTLYNWKKRFMDQYNLWADSLHGTKALEEGTELKDLKARNLGLRILATALGLIGRMAGTVIRRFFQRFSYSFMQASKKTHLRELPKGRRP